MVWASVATKPPGKTYPRRTAEELGLLSYYRGHLIMVLVDDHVTAEITERATHAPLPTKASATLEEGIDLCIERAKRLIDAYIDGAARV